MKKRTWMIAVIATLAGCAPHLQPSLPAYMQSKKLAEPTLALFPHCEGYGCPVVKNVRLGTADWAKIERTYGGKAASAAQEREKIAKTIGIFEQVVGPITGTENDKRGTFIQTGKGQMDCVDESTNTTIYMMLLAEKGLMTFHSVEQPQVRYPIVSGRGWMHQTAVVRETQSGAEYAVDSWFEDNGHGAYIVPIDVWLDGWHPDKGGKDTN